MTDPSLRERLHELVAADPPPPDLADRLIAAAEADAPSAKRRWLPVLAAAACVAIIAIGVAVFVRRGSSPSPADSAPPAPSSGVQCVPSLPAGPAPNANGMGPNPTSVETFWVAGPGSQQCIEQVTGDASIAADLVTALQSVGAVNPSNDDCPTNPATVALQFFYDSPGAASVSVRLDGCGTINLPDGSTVRPTTWLFTLLNRLVPPGFSTPVGMRSRFIPTGSTVDCYLIDPAEGASPGQMADDPVRVDATWQPGRNAPDCREPVTTGDAALARELAAELAAAPPQSTSCPEDDGAGAQLFLSYASGQPPAIIYVKLVGCRLVLRADGRAVAPGPDFFSALAQLAPSTMKSLFN